jgi:hypothetical protein
MRRALRQNGNRAAVAKPDIIKAPTKGWSANSLPIEAEDGTAIVLDNFFPEATAIRPRRGYAEHCTGIGDEVQTLMPFVSGTTQELFAAGNGAIYDVTSSGAVGAAVQSGLSSTKFSYINFATAAGQYLYMVNGADPARHYNGASWVQPVITGVSSSDLIAVTSHKTRLFFIEKNSTTVWYLPVDSIAGAAAAFEVGSQFKRGGRVVGIGTWSVDSGEGLDDLFVLWSSQGEVLIYSGTNPASDYSIVGRYTTGNPIGDRPLFPIGGDLAMISEDGVLALSTVMRYDRLTSKEKSLSARVVDEYLDAVRRYGGAFGWQLVTLPKASMAVLNIPNAGDAGASVQFAYNVSTKAWSRFTGMDASCWELFGSDLYFGSPDGSVYKAESGGTDNGSSIVARCLPAFSHMGSPGRTKHVKLIQPMLSTDLSDYSLGIACVVNFDIPGALGVGSPAAEGTFTWDLSLWDGPDVWGGDAVYDSWESATGIGYVIAPYSEVRIDATDVPNFDFSLIGWNILHEPGTIAFTS